ncbi:MAG: GNAT family N-acetyltransferase [Spirochaetota bacterium]
MIDELSPGPLSGDLLRVFGYSTWMPTEGKTALRVQNQLRNEAARLLVFRDEDGREIGCISYEMDGSAMIVANIAVEIAHRGKGIGRALIDEAIRRCEPRIVELETDDESRGFYEKIGFRTDSIEEPGGSMGRFRCSFEPACVPVA